MKRTEYLRRLMVRKKSKFFPEAREFQIHINRKYNNMLLTLTLSSGKVITTISSGFLGFKGSKRLSPRACEKVARRMAFYVRSLGGVSCTVIVKLQFNSFLWATFRGLRMGGVKIGILKDRIPVPHNGCKKRKARRL